MAHKWLVAILLLVLAGVILFRHVVPSILERSQSRIRFRSISPRSLRGLFVRYGNLTITVERIGFSLLSSSSAVTRQIHFRIQGVVITVADRREKPSTPPPSPPRVIPRKAPRSRYSMHRLSMLFPQPDDLAPPLAMLSRFIPSRFLWTVDSILRPVFRSIFVSFVKMAIRILPSILRIFDVHLDNVTVVFEELMGAHISLRGVTLVMKCEFLQDNSALVLPTHEAIIEDRVRQHKRFARIASGWKNRSIGGAKRVWERAWSSTTGSASFALKFEELLVFSEAPPTSTPPQPSASTLFLPRARTPSISSLYLFPDMAPGLPASVAVVSVSGHSRIKVDVAFTPVTLECRSLVVTASVPSVQVAAGGLFSLKEKFSRLRECSTSLTLPSPAISSLALPSSPRYSPTVPNAIPDENRRQVAWSDQTTDAERPNILKLLKCAELRLASVKITHNLSLDGANPPLSYIAVVDDFFIRGQISDPKDDEAHRKWLGRPSKPNVKLDADVMSFSCGFGKLDISRLSNPDGSHRSPFPLLQIGQCGADVIITQWPGPWMPNALRLGDDPNAAVLICETRVDGLRLSERLELVTQLVALAKQASRSSLPVETNPRPSTPRPLPRVIFDLDVSKMRLRLLHGSPSGADEPFAFEIATEKFTAHAHTSFNEPAFRHIPEDSSPARTTRLEEALPLRMEFEAALFLSPIDASLKFLPPAASDNMSIADSDSWPDSLVDDTPSISSNNSTRSSHSSYSPIGNTILLTSGVELSLFGDTLAASGDAEFTFPLTQTTVDIKGIMDSITIDLRSADAVSSLSILASLFAVERERSHVSAVSSPLLSRLPFGANVHLCIGSLKAGITNLDLNPDEQVEPPISRGIAISTSLTMQFCALRPHHHPRDKRRFAVTHARERLGLVEDIYQQASAFAHDSKDPAERAALLQIVFPASRCWIITCRGDVGHDFPDLENHHGGPITHPESDGRVLFAVPSLSSRVLLRRKLNTFGQLCDSAQITISTTHVYWRFQLLHAYSLLLSVYRLKQSDRSTQPILASPPSAASLNIGVHLEIDSVQGICLLPSDQSIYLRCNSIILESPIQGELAMRWRYLAAWVPSAQPLLRGKWEELGRLKSWSISVKLPHRTQCYTTEIAVTGQSGRIRIPYQYVLADLVLGLTLAVKALQHLSRNVQARMYSDMDPPAAEPAKHIPTIDLHLDYLSLEAADDPFESKLNLIWRTGFNENRARLERALAFDAKLAAIREAEYGREETAAPKQAFEWHFGAEHTVGEEEAWQRLLRYNSTQWSVQFRSALDYQSKREEGNLNRLRDPTNHTHSPLYIDVHPPDSSVPLIRATFTSLQISATEPSFEGEDGLSRFLSDLGQGLPSDTKFTLLIPLHLRWSATGARIGIRDYPLPVVNIPENPTGAPPAWVFDTDLVICEEVGPPSSTAWVPCEIIGAGDESNSTPFSLLVPKSGMPVKTYASPSINVQAQGITDVAWGVSFTPAIPDIMQVLDSLTPPQRDPSPPIGFWDKLRLILHWRVKATFSEELHIHLKGSRDPYVLTETGAGYVFEWKGRPTFIIGHSPGEKELLQLQSDQMFLAIPDLKRFLRTSNQPDSPLVSESPGGLPQPRFRKAGKIIAKLNNGVRMGMGFIFERKCTLQESSTECRIRKFDFLPHYRVALRSSLGKSEDSYLGFRSDSIHMSISLTSPVTMMKSNPGISHNSFHLSPRGFAHFWSWWALFNGPLSLPIRQGRLFPEAKPPTPKFSRHLATIKYRISLSPLFISHIYHQESRAGWKEGRTTCVGVKVIMEKFHADMHQREEEVTVLDARSGGPKTTSQKPFYSAEVVITGAELRAVRASFAEPQKALIHVPLQGNEQGGPSLPDIAPESLSSIWVDLDDFTETNWTPTEEEPKIWLVPCAFCPRFTYFKRIPVKRPATDSHDQQGKEMSMFGDEDTHHCLQGGEDSVHEIQIQFAMDRLTVLENQLQEAMLEIDAYAASLLSGGASTSNPPTGSEARAKDLAKRIQLLGDYIHQLKANQRKARDPKQSDLPYTSYERSYFMPIDEHITAETNWDEFGNVYQIHCLKLLLSDTTRDILLDYYFSSRARRGFEYHMATRAVKFIREQVAPARRKDAPTAAKKPKRVNTKAAANTLRRILTGDLGHDNKGQRPRSHTIGVPIDEFDPQEGWSDDVVVRKGHFVLFLKPQIALRSEVNSESNLILVANGASLQNISVLDLNHLDDAINRSIMNRNYVRLNGLQVFSPTDPSRLDQLRAPDDVPLEVMVDYRCEHGSFARLVPQTDATLQYDKFNRLRLRNGLTAMAAPDGQDHLQHLKTQTDRIMLDIPRFSVAANSTNFSSIYNVVSNLLLYSDPAQKTRNEALDKFIYLYDFQDRPSAATVVENMQRHIRQLEQVARGYELSFDQLDPSGKLDLLSIKSQMYSLTNELDLIFEAISRAQAKAENIDGDQSFATRLDAFSSEISWNMLDDLGNLLAKLTLRGLTYSWLRRNDSSMSNVLNVHDLQALDGSPSAIFSEMLVKYEASGNEDPFMQVDWSVLPPVGGISIIETFDVRLHPIRLQLERKMGRKIMQYVFPRDLGSRAKQIEGPTEKTLADRPRVSLDSSLANQPRSLDVGARRRQLTRSTSQQNLRAANATPGPRKLRKTPSSELLRRPNQVVKATGDTPLPVEDDIAEMQARASRNRTFVSIKMSSLVCVLSYKRDTPLTLTTVPDLDQFKFRTPSFEYVNKIWSFEEAVDALKKDVYKAAWQQKGALLRELALKAKFITPRKFLLDPPEASSTSLASSTSSTDKAGGHRRRWHVFSGRSSSSSSSTTEPRILEDSPLSTSPTSTSFALPPNTSNSSMEVPPVRTRKKSLFR